MLLSLGMGIRQSFGLLLTPVTRDLALTAADFTLAVAVQNIVWGLSQAPVGAIADRFGLRATMMAGAAIYVVGLGVMAAAGGATALIVSGGLIGGGVVLHGFLIGADRRRPSGPGGAAKQDAGRRCRRRVAGTFVMPLATQALLTHQAGQFAALFFMILAIAMLPAGFGPAAPTGCRAEPGPGQRCAWCSARRPAIDPSSSCRGPIRLRPEPHLPRHAPADLPGDLRAGPDAERRGPRGDRRDELHRLARCRLARRAVSEAHPLGASLHPARDRFHRLFRDAPTPASTLVFAAAMGMLWLSVAPLVSGLVAEMFGTRYMATLLGIAFVMHQVGSSLGAWGGGLIFDALGSYDRAWQLGVLIGFGAGIVQIVAGVDPRPRETSWRDDIGPVGTLVGFPSG